MIEWIEEADGKTRCAMCHARLDESGDPTCECWTKCPYCDEWFNPDDLDPSGVCQRCVMIEASDDDFADPGPGVSPLQREEPTEGRPRSKQA